MRTIWKFPIDVTDRQTIRVPAAHKFLCVQVQDGRPCLWAEVDENPPWTVGPYDMPVDVFIHGTGQPMPEHLGHYLGTFQLQEGGYVGHVYVKGAVA